jgi:gamma-glutamyl hercynylcysteine S-oxide synthase
VDLTVARDQDRRLGKEDLAAALLEARRRTEGLLAPVDDARLAEQHDELMSPLVWDYGHIAVYEELWLVQQLSGAAPVDVERMRVYDAFENPRRVRASLPLMSRTEVAAYRDGVDARALALLEEADLGGDDPLLRDGFVHRMIVEHEHQHGETILQTLQLLRGGYHPDPVAAPQPRHAVEPGMVTVPGGEYTVGNDDHAPWDNEHPRHRVRLAPYRIGRHPVSCAEFAEFVEDGGYRRPELWAPAGWRFREEAGLSAPKHWHRDRGDRGGWLTERFGDTAAVDMRTPVMHVCWYEADAYCRWAGVRLPTEQEWEVAASWDPLAGRARRFPWGDTPPTADLANLDQRLYGCAPLGAYPDGASPLGCEQMVGDVWEWTASDFLPYPGFTAFPYREYSEVFHGDAYKVLRGASWAARPSVARVTFRNWDYPIRRQIFAGFRVADGGTDL